MTRRPPRRDYSPVPGTERCPLCREMGGPDHVPHPLSQIVVWLWESSPAWRWVFSLGAVAVTVFLAGFIAAFRTLLFT